MDQQTPNRDRLVAEQLRHRRDLLNWQAGELDAEFNRLQGLLAWHRERLLDGISRQGEEVEAQLRADCDNCHSDKDDSIEGDVIGYLGNLRHRLSTLLPRLGRQPPPRIGRMDAAAASERAERIAAPGIDAPSLVAVVADTRRLQLSADSQPPRIRVSEAAEGAEAGQSEWSGVQPPCLAVAHAGDGSALCRLSLVLPSPTRLMVPLHPAGLAAGDHIAGLSVCNSDGLLAVSVVKATEGGAGSGVLLTDLAGRTVRRLVGRDFGIDYPICLFFGLCFGDKPDELFALAVATNRPAGGEASADDGTGRVEASALLASTRAGWAPVNVSHLFRCGPEGGGELAFSLARRPPHLYASSARPPCAAKLCEFTQRLVAVLPPAGRGGSQVGQSNCYSLSCPSACAVDSRGLLYLADSDGACVNAISANGDLIYRLARADMRRPVGLAVYESDNAAAGDPVRLFVADAGADCVWAFDLP